MMYGVFSFLSFFIQPCPKNSLCVCGSRLTVVNTQQRAANLCQHSDEGARPAATHSYGMNLNTTWSSRVSCSAISNAEWHSKGSAFPADIWDDQNSSEASKVAAGRESAAEQRRKWTNLWSKWIRTFIGVSCTIHFRHINSCLLVSYPEMIYIMIQCPQTFVHMQFQTPH